MSTRPKPTKTKKTRKYLRTYQNRRKGKKTTVTLRAKS